MYGLNGGLAWWPSGTVSSSPPHYHLIYTFLLSNENWHINTPTLTRGLYSRQHMTRTCVPLQEILQSHYWGTGTHYNDVIISHKDHCGDCHGNCYCEIRYQHILSSHQVSWCLVWMYGLNGGLIRPTDGYPLHVWDSNHTHPRLG